MENVVIDETLEILKQLSPENQVYFMTLMRLAQKVENGVRNTVIEQPKKNDDE